MKFTKLSIRARIIILIILLGITPTISLVYYTNYELKPAIFDDDSHNLDVLLINIADLLEINSKEVEQVLFAMSSSPSIRKWIESNNTEDFEETHQFFSQYANFLDSIAQIRYIDETGQERIRYNIAMNNTDIIRVAEESLQNKIHRDYYKDTMQLDENSTYISHLNLNIEDYQIEFVDGDVVPMIRHAIPIYHLGNFKGIIVLNYYYNQIYFNAIQTLIDEYEEIEIALIDNTGYFLFNTKLPKWSAPENLNTNETIYDFQTGELRYEDEGIHIENPGYFTTLHVISIEFFDPEFGLFLYTNINNEAFTLFIDQSLIILFSTIILVTLISWFFFYKLTMRTLREYTAICAKCKMIREVDGKWMLVEDWIQSKMDTNITHGFCDTCFDEIMKDLDQEKE